MRRGVVIVLKVLVVSVLAGMLGALFWGLPWLSGEMARDLPELAHLRLPLLVLGEVALLGGIVVLACLWQLLTRVSEGRIFDPASLRWVAAMSTASAVAGVACVAAEFWIPGPPLLGLGVLVVALLCLGLALVLVVMRGLLVQATSFRSELDQVI